jgi:DNA invertase Pin-like site-specific DNA recombinase
LKFGYCRVSTRKQDLQLQLDALHKHGAEEIIQETGSGKKKDRPGLVSLFDKLRKDDEIIIWKLDRLSRSAKDLIDLSEQLREKGVKLISIQDNIDTETAHGRMFFTIMAALAEMEHENMLERTHAGLASARARGRKGGRPPADQKKVQKALTMYDSRDYSISEICKTFDISQGTLYRYINERKEKAK